MPPRPLREDVEETYTGDTLCIDSWSGKRFRASEKWVNEKIELFIGYCTIGMRDQPIELLFDLLNVRSPYISKEYGYSGYEKGTKRIDIHTRFDTSMSLANEPVLVIEYGKNSKPDVLLPFK